jgi:hypothetical protein
MTRSGPSANLLRLTPVYVHLRIDAILASAHKVISDKGKPDQSQGCNASGPCFLREAMYDSPKDPRLPGCRLVFQSQLGDNAMKRYWIALCSLIICACGGGGGVDIGGISTGPIVIADVAVDGVWLGADEDGNQTLALVTEAGRLSWISLDTGEQGFGTVSVRAITSTIELTLVPSWGTTLADGSTSATCDGGGSVGEHDFWLATLHCTTRSGGSIESFTEFTYDALYDRDSSLATIAGDYDDSGSVISVSATGEIFEQDPGTGCVLNGQVSIIDARFNIYDVSVTYSNCMGDTAVLNGSTFAGLGTLDNSKMPETAVVGLTGDVGTETYSAIYVLPRL